MSRRTWSLIIGVVVGAGPAGSAAAWHDTFQDFFNASGGSFSSGRATAKKCGPGGKLGTYDYRSFSQAGGGDTEISFEVLAELSARENFRKLKRVEVNYEHSPDIPEDIAAEAAGALAEFHETVFTRYKPGKRPRQAAHPPRRRWSCSAP